MVNQKDRLQQRLAERKRSRAIRANSTAVNQTLPLNFENNQSKLMMGEGANDLSVVNVSVPMMQTSAMNSSGQQA